MKKDKDYEKEIETNTKRYTKEEILKSIYKILHTL